MADLAIPHNFSPNTPAKSEEVNANFSAVQTFVNDPSNTPQYQRPLIAKSVRSTQSGIASNQSGGAAAGSYLGVSVTWAMPDLATLGANLKITMCMHPVVLGSTPVDGTELQYRLRTTAAATGGVTKAYAASTATQLIDAFGTDGSPYPIANSTTLFTSNSDFGYGAGSTVNLYLWGLMTGELGRFTDSPGDGNRSVILVELV